MSVFRALLMKGRHWKCKRGEEKMQVHGLVLGVGASDGQ